MMSPKPCLSTVSGVGGVVGFGGGVGVGGSAGGKERMVAVPLNDLQEFPALPERVAGYLKGMADLRKVTGAGSGADLRKVREAGSGADLRKVRGAGSVADLRKVRKAGSGADLWKVRGSDLRKVRGARSGADLQKVREVGSGADFSKVKGAGSGVDLRKVREVGKKAVKGEVRGRSEGQRRELDSKEFPVFYFSPKKSVRTEKKMAIAGIGKRKQEVDEEGFSLVWRRGRGKNGLTPRKVSQTAEANEDAKADDSPFVAESRDEEEEEVIPQLDGHGDEELGAGSGPEFRKARGMEFPARPEGGKSKNTFSEQNEQMVTEFEVKIPIIDFRKRKAEKVDEGLAKINHFIQQVDGNDDDVNDTAPGWLCHNCFDVFTRKSSLHRHMKSCEQAKSDYYTVDTVEKETVDAEKKEFLCEQCKKSYSRLDTLQKHLRVQHKMQKSDPFYPTLKNSNFQTVKDHDWTIGNFDIEGLVECELKEGKENLCFNDPDSDAEVGFGGRLLLGSTDDTMDEDISSPSSRSPSQVEPTSETTKSSTSFAEISMELAQDDVREEKEGSHSRDLDSNTVEPTIELSGALDYKSVSDDEMETFESLPFTVYNSVTDTDTVEENSPPSLVEPTFEISESSNSFAEISMDLDHEQGHVGFEKEGNEEMGEEQPSLEQQIHSILKKEKVPLTQAGIRYLCFLKKDVDFQKIWKEFLGHGSEKSAFNKLRKFNSLKLSYSKLPEIPIVPWKGNSEKPSLESILGLPKYFENYPNKCKKDDVNVLLCKNKGFRTTFLGWCGTQKEEDQNEDRLFRLFDAMMTRKKLPIALADYLYDHWPRDKKVNAQNLENVCRDSKPFEHAFNIFKDIYSGNIETLRSSLRNH